MLEPCLLQPCFHVAGLLSLRLDICFDVYIIGVYICVYISKYMYMYTCKYIYIGHRYEYVCIYIYIYIYTQNYTYTGGCAPTQGGNIFRLSM